MDYNNNNYQNVQPAQNVQPGVNPYMAPNAYGAPVNNANPNNGFAIGSLICGIVGILCCCCCGGGTVIGIVGIILAVVSRGKNGGKMSGLAIAGLVCSIIASVFGIIGAIYMLGAGGVDAFIDGFYEGYYGY